MMTRAKIFGIGLNKTGTTTLGRCFELLEFSHVSCRRDLLIKHLAGEYEDIFAILDNYESFENWPYPLMYEELFKRYQDARFILTIRKSAETWLESLKLHSLTTHPDNHCRKLTYGFDYPFGHEEEHLHFYRDHKNRVLEFFYRNNALERLKVLCWEQGDSWPEVCGFLGTSIPDAEFPHQNESRLKKARKWEQENRRRAGFF